MIVIVPGVAGFTDRTVTYICPVFETEQADLS